MASATSLYKTTFRIPICPKDLGHFIGKGGSNYKKIILESKKKILGIADSDEVPRDDWNKVTILLKFDKQDTDCLALLGCNSSQHSDKIQEVLAKYVKIHNDETEYYEKKAAAPKTLVYRIGAPHHLIGRFIGVGGANVAELKNIIQNVEGVEDYPRIFIEEQRCRLSGPFRNMGERNSPENIIIKVTFKGAPKFDDIHKIMEDFVESYSQGDEAEGYDAFAPDPDEDDFWNSFDEVDAERKAKEEEEAEREHREAVRKAAEEEAKRKAEEEAKRKAEKEKQQKARESEPEPEPEPEPKKGYAYDKYYRVLGIPTSSSLRDVKKAYRKLAVKNHPDKGGDEEMFKKIQEAFEKLLGKEMPEQE